VTPRPAPHDDSATRVWQALRAFVLAHDQRDELRDTLGLGRGTGRIKVLLRLTEGPLTLRDIAEFTGVGKALLVAPGKHKIKISLPGYHTFETDIDLMANQKSTIKTDMVTGGPAEGSPLPQ